MNIDENNQKMYEDAFDIWPATIIKDRYCGAYSKAQWLAFMVDVTGGLKNAIPKEIGGSDECEMRFWYNYGLEKEKSILIGFGNTPNEAIIDLNNKKLKKWPLHGDRYK